MSDEKRIQVSLGGPILKYLRPSISYQFVSRDASAYTHYEKDSYYARNVVNRFTQPNGTRIIPYNGVFISDNPLKGSTHAVRGQIDFDRTIQGIHAITAMVGTDVRSSMTRRFPAAVLYNFDDNYMIGTNIYNYDQNYRTMPNGTNARISPPNRLHSMTFGRELSYYAVSGYAYKGKYVLNGSIRWDGTNFFGVKTNARGVPLWSVGASWIPSNESRFSLPMSYLKLRMTYGVAGNVNKQTTHFPTIQHGISTTGLPQAALLYVGNPSLRWEKVRIMNMGIDFSLFKNKLGGTVESYVKWGSDLIGDALMDPTTGVEGGYKINYADIRSQGVDLKLNSSNRLGEWGWDIRMNLSYVKNRITNYYMDESTGTTSFLQSRIPPPNKGKSKDVIYAYPVNALNPESGLPLIFIDGVISDQYLTYVREAMRSYMDLEDVGVRIPTMYGSLINQLSWKSLGVSFQISFKGGHVFRRNSMDPLGEQKHTYHRDYYSRWQKPGDERSTIVPRKILQTESDSQITAASTVYKYSMGLVTPGEHLRFQQLNLYYNFPNSSILGASFRKLAISANVSDLGILWSRNRMHLDPDYHESLFTPPTSFTMGFSLNF